MNAHRALRRPHGRGLLVAALLAGGLGGVAAAAPALAAPSQRLTQAQAVRIADQPVRLGAIGPITLVSAAVRPAAAWGPPVPVGASPSALVWHVTFRGLFHVTPCLARPIPSLLPQFICAFATVPAPRSVACPALPRWPYPPPGCLGTWHLSATVSIADANGAWLGAVYGPAVGFGHWRPPPRIIARPRPGGLIDLTLGQLLVLGPARTAPGGHLSPYRSSDPAVLAPVPVAVGVASAGTMFLAEHTGTATLTATWQPNCAAGVPCPALVALVTLRVRVFLPIEPPPAA